MSTLEDTGPGLVERPWTLEMDRPKIFSSTRERPLTYPVPNPSCLSVILGMVPRIECTPGKCSTNFTYLFVWLVLLIYFETGSYVASAGLNTYVAEDDFKLLILLPSTSQVLVLQAWLSIFF